MNNVYFLKAILVSGIVTLLLRSVPSILFHNRSIPRSFIRLGKILPPAMMAVLVVYCLKDAQFFYGNYAIPELISVLVCGAIYVCKKNAILSIAGSTFLYMLMVQYFC